MQWCGKCIWVKGDYAWTKSPCVCRRGGAVLGHVYMHKEGCVHTHKECLYVQMH